MIDTLSLIWRNIYLRVILVTFATIAILLFLAKTQLAWGCFLGAFLIAYLVDPIVTKLSQNRFFPRWLAVIFIMAFIVTFIFMGVLLFTNILFEVTTMQAGLGKSWASFMQWLNTTAPRWFVEPFNRAVEVISQSVDYELLEKWKEEALKVEFLSNSVSNLFRGVGQFLESIIHLLEMVFQVFILLVLTTFTLASFPLIKSSLFELFPLRHRFFIEELTSKLDSSVGGYMRAKALEAFIMGIAVWAALFVIGVPEAISLGFLAMIFNPIPYLGPFMATITATVMALVTLGWQEALVVLIVMQILEQIDGNILGPMLLSKGVHVHPVAILVSLLTGGALFGFWGLLLAVPATALLQALYRDYYKSSKWYKKPPEKATLE